MSVEGGSDSGRRRHRSSGARWRRPLTSLQETKNDKKRHRTRNEKDHKLQKSKRMQNFNHRKEMAQLQMEPSEEILHGAFSSSNDQCSQRASSPGCITTDSAPTMPGSPSKHESVCQRLVSLAPPGTAPLAAATVCADPSTTIPASAAHSSKNLDQISM